MWINYSDNEIAYTTKDGTIWIKIKLCRHKSGAKSWTIEHYSKPIVSIPKKPFFNLNEAKLEAEKLIHEYIKE